jgi:hypothetical protein
VGFQAPITIEKVLAGLQAREYVLPAIQREFVWSTDQIATLFDSLMRGYPIGSFLFWKVEPERADDYVFYDFIRDYHELDRPYAQTVKLPPGQGTVAILDGQQRLTSLNIGLYGSHAERLPRKWKGIPENYPEKRLYLAIDQKRRDEDLGLEYDLQFLTSKEASPREGDPDRWFLVGDVLKFDNSGPAIHKVVASRGLLESEAFDILYDLYRAVREREFINYYLEESQDPDKVLDIFVRVNSAGTVLSYSDLLLSMATNQWQERDARKEVRSLVDDVNDVGHGFSFDKDRLLKAGLVLIDVSDIAFKVSNFTSANMAKLEKEWDEVRSAILLAARLLGSFGFSDRNLTADSVITPVAYYVKMRGLKTNYLDSSAHAADRETMRQWVTRSLVKRGVWGSGLDTLLGRLREELREHGHSGFPRSELEKAMSALGKPLSLDEAEVDELLELKYGARRSFPVLSLLYPGLDLTKQFHEDHVFPRSKFTRRRLRTADIPEAEIDQYLTRVDQLPNLQLLPGGPNIEKSDMIPADWIHGPHFPTGDKRKTYLEENDLDGLPLELPQFLTFFEGRKTRMRQRLSDILGPETATVGTTSDGGLLG